MRFDLMVLGGGPGGYSAAIAAAKGGLKVVLFEKEKLGGTCLNVGCIPTKYLLDKAGVLEKIRSLTGKGCFRDAGSYSFNAVQKGKAEVVDKLVGGVGALLKASGVAVARGEARLTAPGRAVCGGAEYEADYTIIATGSRPAGLPIPGAELCIDSTEALALGKVPQRLAVIGGGVIGLELASAYASFGSEVTVIEMMDAILPNEEKSVASQLVKVLASRGIKIATGSRVQRVEKTGGEASLRVRYAGPRGEETAEADVVLMAIGRKASLIGVDASSLGLEITDKGCLKVDENMRCCVENVYAVGDAAGGYQLAHAAYAEAEAAVADILWKHSEAGAKAAAPRPVDMRAIPRCVYTLPCFAAVGLTLDQAKKEGRDAVLGTFRYEGNGMALAEGASGMVCVVMDKSDGTTLGAHIVGENASELIAFAASAVAGKMNVEAWERLIVAHPSLSEMVREAALDAFGKSVHTIKAK